MREKDNNWLEYSILGVLGALVILTLVLPQLLRDRRPPQLLAVSVLFRDVESSGWTAARQGMEQAADELGAELRFLTLTASGDSGEQEELMVREMDGGADALVIVPTDPAVLSTALLQRQTPCPVVTLEEPMEGGSGTVSPDNREVGRSLAQALLEDWEEGRVLLLDNRAACPEAGPRLDAALEVLTEAGVPAFPVKTLPEGAVSDRWVMAFEAGATRQAVEKKTAEEQPFILYGVGSSTAITAQLEQKNIAAIAAWSDYAAGYLAVQQAVQAIREPSEELDPLPFAIVRGEDIYAPENQKLLFPVMSSSGR